MAQRTTFEETAHWRQTAANAVWDTVLAGDVGALAVGTFRAGKLAASCLPRLEGDQSALPVLKRFGQLARAIGCDAVAMIEHRPLSTKERVQEWGGQVDPLALWVVLTAVVLADRSCRASAQPVLRDDRGHLDRYPEAVELPELPPPWPGALARSVARAGAAPDFTSGWRIAGGLVTDFHAVVVAGDTVLGLENARQERSAMRHGYRVGRAKQRRQR